MLAESSVDAPYDVENGKTPGQELTKRGEHLSTLRVKVSYQRYQDDIVIGRGSSFPYESCPKTPPNSQGSEDSKDNSDSKQADSHDSF